MEVGKHKHSRNARFASKKQSPGQLFWVFEWTSSLASELRSIFVVFNSCGQFFTFPTKETTRFSVSLFFLPKFYPLLQLGYSAELCFAKANEKIVLVEGQSTNLKDLVASNCLKWWEWSWWMEICNDCIVTNHLQDTKIIDITKCTLNVWHVLTFDQEKQET